MAWVPPSMQGFLPPLTRTLLLRLQHVAMTCWHAALCAKGWNSSNRSGGNANRDLSLQVALGQCAMEFEATATARNNKMYTGHASRCLYTTLAVRAINA